MRLLRAGGVLDIRFPCTGGVLPGSQNGACGSREHLQHFLPAKPSQVLVVPEPLAA